MNNDILTDYELRGYWIGYGTGYGTGFGYRNIDDDVYEYFKNLKIYVKYNIPTRVVNYYKEVIDMYA